MRYPDHGESAAYLAFGRGLGYMNGEWRDVHGAGCQRSDPKTGDPADYPFGHGPQGDAVRIFNHVRAVRDADPGDCTYDADGDGVCDDIDNCPEIGNPDQQPVVFGQEITVGGYCSGDLGQNCTACDDCAMGQSCLEGAVEWADPVGYDHAIGEFLSSSDIDGYPTSVAGSGSGVRIVDPGSPAPGTGRWYLLRPSCAAGSWQTELGQEPVRDSILP